MAPLHVRLDRERGVAVISIVLLIRVPMYVHRKMRNGKGVTVDNDDDFN